MRERETPTYLEKIKGDLSQHICRTFLPIFVCYMYIGKVSYQYKAVRAISDIFKEIKYKFLIPDAGGQVQVNPATGQPDYSIQWAEYYRSLGMHREAEMIEQQAKASKVCY